MEHGPLYRYVETPPYDSNPKLKDTAHSQADTKEQTCNTGGKPTMMTLKQL